MAAHATLTMVSEWCKTKTKAVDLDEYPEVSSFCSSPSNPYVTARDFDYSAAMPSSGISQAFGNLKFIYDDADFRIDSADDQGGHSKARNSDGDSQTLMDTVTEGCNGSDCVTLEARALKTSFETVLTSSLSITYLTENCSDSSLTSTTRQNKSVSTYGEPIKITDVDKAPSSTARAAAADSPASWGPVSLNCARSIAARGKEEPQVGTAVLFMGTVDCVKHHNLCWGAPLGLGIGVGWVSGPLLLFLGRMAWRRMTGHGDYAKRRGEWS